jgi:hypothetical protein
VTTDDAGHKRTIPGGRLGRRGFAAALLAPAVVLILLAAVAYAAVKAPADPSPAKLLRAAGTVKISNSRGGDALVGMKDMMPGDRVSGTVKIGNASRKIRERFYLGLSKLVETNGPNGGRLSYRLVLVVKRLSAARRPQVLYRGPLRRMPLMKLGKFRPRETRKYKFTVLFPEGPSSLDNRFQGSAVSLQFTWLARQAR